MPNFPEPKFPFDYDVNVEIERLRRHKRKRGIPSRKRDTLLIATWNIANLGAQHRRSFDRVLMAQILRWFDIIAIQECRENYGDLLDIQNNLPRSYRVLMSDAAGNNERMSFLYDSKKLTPLEEIGEIAFPPSQYAGIKVPGVKRQFNGFDRTPYLAAFSVGKTSITLVNVHLYFGAGGRASIERRILETFAVAKWSQRRSRSSFSTTRELIALGDFNMPLSEPGDPIYNALTRLGLELPEHSTQITSTIASDANYDQIAFLPGTVKDLFSGRKGVFDFDTVLFPELWQEGKNAKNFKAYMRYYLSDHRPMWVELNV